MQSHAALPPAERQQAIAAVRGQLLALCYLALVAVAAALLAPWAQPSAFQGLAFTLTAGLGLIGLATCFAGSAQDRARAEDAGPGLRAHLAASTTIVAVLSALLLALLLVR